MKRVGRKRRKIGRMKKTERGQSQITGVDSDRKRERKRKMKQMRSFQEEW
jgi:hypothetical protein